MRRHVILANFDPLRAIILRDRLLVIVPDGADSLLADLERRVRGGIQEYEASVFGDASEEDSGTVQRYKKKPSGHLGAKLVTKAVKKSADIVKKAIGRNSGHPSVTIVPPPTTPATLSETPPQSTSTARDATTSEGSMADDDRQYARLESSEWEELKGNDWKELPFELQCMDGTTIVCDGDRLFRNFFFFSHLPFPLAILHVVTNGLYEETFDLQVRDTRKSGC